MQLFLNSRHQSVVLNGQLLKWSLFEADVPQGSILGSLLFLAYINDLWQQLRYNIKPFAKDTCINPAISSSNLNEDLLIITHCTYQLKSSFNPDITKKHEKLFFKKANMIQVIQVYTLIMHEYNRNLFQNKLVIT